MRGTSLCTTFVPHGLPQWPIWAQYSSTLQSTTSMHGIVYHLLFVDDTTLLSQGSTPTLAEEMAAHLLESSGRWWLDSNKVMLI